MKRGWKIAATLAGAVLVAVLLRNFVATSCLIPSSGMEHTLYQGDRIWVNRWSYGLRLPWMSLWGYHRWGGAPVEKGDVVVFNNPSNLTEPFADRREVFIGRCVASPGDTLWVDSLFRIMPSAGSPDSVRRLWHVLVVPAKGDSVAVEAWNRTLLCNTLALHEGHRAEVKSDTLYVDGIPVRQCRFTQDYCWVSSDNPANLSDSRLFGFVPETHVIGRAVRIWFSKEPGTGLLRGYRWKRMGIKVE